MGTVGFLSILGTSILVYAQLVPTHLKFEAEQGIMSGQVSAYNDSQASAGSYVSFTNAPTGELFSFLETFDGTPTNPEPWNPRDWDVFQTVRDNNSWENPEATDAHHAYHNCGDVASGGSHQITTWPETVFKCNGHVMTSSNGNPGYAAIYLSPPAMVDFSHGPATVSFDVSTFVSAERDWIDVLITPFEDIMSYPFRSDLDVDGSGLPNRGIHLEQEFGSDYWELEIVRNNTDQILGTLDIPYSQIGGPSRVTRTPVKIEITRTSLTMSYPTVPGASRTVNFADLGWTQGVVQFGHHSYTPDKDGDLPNTWHWDNIAINPARSFYQWQATPERTGKRIDDYNAGRFLDFGKPAPANAVLSFSGSCGIQVRDSPSSAWRNTTIIGPNNHPEHVQSYEVPVSQGQLQIEFRFTDNSWFGPGFGCQLANPIIKALL